MEENQIVQEIMPSLYQIQVPLPPGPLKVLNSYVIIGAERNLLIDAGMNFPASIEAFERAFAELKLDVTKTDFLATHMHSDHSGLIAYLKSPASRVFASKEDGDRIWAIENTPDEDFGKRAVGARLTGMPEEQIQDSFRNHPGFRYRGAGIGIIETLEEGDELTYGPYRFQIVSTPGHTSGHICLWEKEKGFLIAGDHVLGNISPNISLMGGEGNPLAEFLSSLEKIKKLNLQRILPGHRQVIEDPNGRIDELIEHYHIRLNELEKLVAEKPGQSAYELAPLLTWRIRSRSWEDFPIAQKWFANAEANAHLRYLEREGRIQSELINGVFRFSVK